MKRGMPSSHKGEPPAGNTRRPKKKRKRAGGGGDDGGRDGDHPKRDRKQDDLPGQQCKLITGMKWDMASDMTYQLNTIKNEIGRQSKQRSQNNYQK